MDINTLLAKFREYKAKKSEAEAQSDSIEIMLCDNSLKFLAAEITKLTEQSQAVAQVKQFEQQKQAYQVEVDKLDDQIEAYSMQYEEVQAWKEIKDFL